MKIRLLTTVKRYLHPGSAVAFWHTEIGPVFYDYASLADYYIDFTAKLGYRGPRDADGIPMLEYFGEPGLQYNPCAVAQWGLGAYQAWRRGGDEVAGAEFRKAAAWLLNRLDVDGDGRGFWWYTFDFDAYGLRAPWASALAQAQGISVLLRAHLVLGGDEFLQAARQACAAMLSPVADGGVLLEHDGMVLLEEVVADRPTAILDGLMFAVMGLRDYCFVVPGDARARELLARCIGTIRDILPRYDLGYWSRADLYSVEPPMPASGFYHRLHVAQLRVLADLANEEVFADFARRWDKARQSPINRARAFGNKLAFKIFHY